MLKSVNGLITVDVFDLVSGSLFLLESKSDNNNNKDNNVAFEFCCFLIMLLLLFLSFSLKKLFLNLWSILKVVFTTDRDLTNVQLKRSGNLPPQWFTSKA